MNFRTATLLVLGMFGSFAVVIATMMALFWAPSARPGSRKPQQTTEQPATAKPTEKPDTADTATVLVAEQEPEAVTTPPADPDRANSHIAVPPEQLPPQPAEPPDAVEPRPRPRVTGRATQRNVQLEQEEMKLLRKEMERRLQERIDLRDRKFNQLARQCENLEPGEAVQILVALDDTDLGEVLKRMDREKALPIAALLTRLNRQNAIKLKE